MFGNICTYVLKNVGIRYDKIKTRSQARQEACQLD